MRERLVGLKLKLQRDLIIITKETGELQNRMASSTPVITPEKVVGVGKTLREKLYDGTSGASTGLRTAADGRSPSYRRGNSRQRVKICSGEMRRGWRRRNSAQSSFFCSRVARPKRFEPRTPRFVVCSYSFATVSRYTAYYYDKFRNYQFYYLFRTIA